MAFIAKVYNVLIASPSDVSEEREIIPKVLHNWNTTHSEHYKIVFLPIKWETHTIPEMGARPQELINSQIVNKSDILIGAFWTKLGTHTGVAESGTVEEIQQFKKSTKNVMLYFSNKPVMPDSINFEQYQKLKDFKSSCQSEGLYDTYDSCEILENKITNHLTLFAKANSNVSDSNIAVTNQLSIAFYHPKTQEISTEVNSFKWSHLSKSKLIEKKMTAIKQLVDKISTIKLPTRTVKTESELILKVPVSISPEEQNKYIKIHEEIMGTSLEKDFFEFGNLRKSSLNFNLHLGGSPSYSGTDAENEKFNLYKNFRDNLSELDGFINYFGYLEGFNVAPLILMNLGHQFNESITVKLMLSNDIQILNAKHIDKPNYYIIEAFTNELLNEILKPKEDSNTLEYYLENQYSPHLPSSYMPFPKSFEYKWNELQESFEDEANEVLYFEVYKSSNMQTLKFIFDELNPSTNMWFPCYLLLKSTKTFNIDYEITSKNLPKKLTGTLVYKI